uniref:Cytochrome b n=1 Tax=Perkinsus marinus TaxID=31276 RepID=UPI003F778504
FILIIKDNIILYNINDSINYLWNIGYIIMVVMIVQVITGIIINLYMNINNGYKGIIYIIKEIYYGYILRYIHNNNSTLIYVVVYLHIIRNLYYKTYYYNILIWYSGMIMLYQLIIIGFIGYILGWGQLSYWGITVIINLISGIPYLILLISGNYYITIVTIKRLYIVHFILPIILIYVEIIHVYYIHYLINNNIVEYNVNNKIIFNNYILVKDNNGIIFILNIFILELNNNIFIIADNDNLIEINILVTPIHIIPEWYYLYWYSILKLLPNKYSGLYIVVNSISIINILSEYKIVISEYKNYKNIIWYNQIIQYISMIYIGIQLPIIEYINYGRYIIIFNILLLIMYLYPKKKK